MKPLRYVIHETDTGKVMIYRDKTGLWRLTFWLDSSYRLVRPVTAGSLDELEDILQKAIDAIGIIRRDLYFEKLEKEREKLQKIRHKVIE